MAVPHTIMIDIMIDIMIKGPQQGKGPMADNLIALASPHMHPVGRGCGEARVSHDIMINNCPLGH